MLEVQQDSKAEERNGTGPKSRDSKNMENRMASFRDSSNSSMSNCKVVGREPAWYGGHGS
ncbi:hypothetical protein K0M31_005906 [Melipona bicolor]|uniref:Uncharacterized protein n=1 Tax=Melipona bicolor TaxID=60889 RepID=A0AA40KM61_9HYME|nr:hypothetical protein K0M31_005906 [Melipona bicolor]